MEHAAWSGLGPVSTPLEEQGPGVEEISQVPLPEVGGRGGGQAETAGLSQNY